MRRRRADDHAGPAQPRGLFTSVDVSADSIAEAKRRIDEAGLANVELRQADIFALPFDAESFDHLFVCFVLEHLPRPVEALGVLNGLLRPGGTVTVIEGDHGSAYFHQRGGAGGDPVPSQLQTRAGGDALIGRQLHPLMVAAGLEGVDVSPGWSTWTRTARSWSTGSRARPSPR